MLAYAIAKENNLFIVAVREGFVVYRRGAFEGARGERLGRRKTASALLGFVKKLAGKNAL